MGLTYVIADIHGAYDVMAAALSEIKSRGGKRIIFTGDYIDRGPESKRVVSHLMDAPAEWSIIRGNHEDMALHCADGTDLNWWIGNGGAETLASYGGAMDPDHLAWFDSLPRLLWDDHRVYVHAGIDYTRPLDQQPEKTTQWHRYGKREGFGAHGRHVVHGHTPVAAPELHLGRTNLDTGAVFTGLLTVGVFEDDTPGGPIDLIEVRA